MAGYEGKCRFYCYNPKISNPPSNARTTPPIPSFMMLSPGPVGNIRGACCFGIAVGSVVATYCCGGCTASTGCVGCGATGQEHEVLVVHDGFRQAPATQERPAWQFSFDEQV